MARQLKQLGGKKLSTDDGKRLLEKLRGAFDSGETNESPECAICLTEMEESAAVILRSCGHLFCGNCTNRKSVCPLCREKFNKNDMIQKGKALTAGEVGSPATSISEVGDKEFGRTPKVEALLVAIQEMKPDEKAVISNQFTSFHDVIQVELKKEGHAMTRIDGSMSGKRRLGAVKDFDSDDESKPQFILCSLHAAGCGYVFITLLHTGQCVNDVLLLLTSIQLLQYQLYRINLIRGNVAFLLMDMVHDAVEAQAADRIHRSGQKRDVQVYRFVMKDSIEERIITLQETKATLGKGAMQKLTPDEKRKARISALRDRFLLGKEGCCCWFSEILCLA